MRKHARNALIAPLFYLLTSAAAPAEAAAAATATATANLDQHTAEKRRGDDGSLLDQHLSQQQLRRTIEDSVLNRLATGIVAHHEKVERGERRRRPFVTLTYAQSIDGSIAGADKSQVFLSGSESQTMTHGLRSIHDAILVGAGTVRQDNPRLNVRHWPPANPSAAPSDGGNSDSHLPGGERAPERPSKGQAGGGGRAAETQAPRAVILAGSLSELPRSMRLGGAVVFTNLQCPEASRWLAEWAQRSEEGSQDLAANDFVIVHCRLRPDGRCDLGDCLEKLYLMGFKSLMVEGGATVISSFLRGYQEDKSMDEGGDGFDGQLVDRVVVTVAPMFLQGYNVLATGANSGDASSASGSGFPLPLLDVGYVRLGQDLVVVGAPARCCL
eukprot:g6609.t1